MDNIITDINDIGCNLIVRVNTNSELNSNIKIHPSNKMVGKVVIKHIEQEVSTDKQDVYSTIFVKQKNKMFGKIEIVEKIKRDLTLFPIEDSFTRNSYPTFNYGSQKDLITGINPTTKEKFYTYVKFGIYDKIPKDTIFTKACIKANTIRNIKTNNILQIYEASCIWSEYGITYANQPPLGRLLKEIDLNTINNNTVEIDILDVMTNVMQGKIARYGLILVLKDETKEDFVRFYSKESEFPPTIELEYFDNSPISFSQSNLTNTITVARRELSDVDNNLVVPTHDVDEDINSTITVKNTGYLDSVINISNGSVINKLKVYNITSLGSSLTVQRDNLKGTLFIPYYNKIDNTIKVKNENVSEIDCTISINKPVLDNTMLIYNFKDIDSRVIIRKNNDLDLNNTIIIRESKDIDIRNRLITTKINEITSNISVLPTSETKNKISIRNYKDENINNSMLVYGASNLNGILLIRESSNSSLSSELKVRRYDDNTINSLIEITEHEDKEGLIYINNPQISSSISVKGYGNSDIDNKITILPTSEINNTIIITKYENLNNTMLVKIPFADDCESVLRIKDKGTLNNIITVRNNLDNDKSSAIYIKQDWANSKIAINNPNLNSNITINQPELFNNLEVFKTVIDNKIEIFKTAIDGKLIVSNPFVDNSITVNRSALSSTITVNRKIIESVIKVREVINEDITNTLNIVNQGSSDLNFSLKINPSNKMYGKIEIEPPKKLTLTLSPIADAYVRDDMSNFNFGKTNDMFVGKASNGISYESFIKFDLGKIPSNIYISNARLVISKGIFKQSNLQFYSLSSNWLEENITYNNKPNMNEFIGKSIDEESNTSLSLDITNILNDKIEREKLKNGLMIIQDSASELQRLYTRESDSPPRLIIEYYDLSTPSNYSKEVLSSIIVKTVDNSNINTSLVVPIHDIDEDLNSSIVVKNNSFLDTKLTVVKDSIENAISVKRDGFNDTNGLIKVQLHNVDDILCSLKVSNQEVNNTITVKRNEVSDISNTINVARNEYNHLTNSINVRVKEDNNKNSLLYVNNNAIHNNIIVTTNSTINSALYVRNDAENNIESEIEVGHFKELLNTIFVNPLSVVPNEITIRNEKDKDISNSINVNNINQLNNSIVITPVSDFQNNVIIRRNEVSQLNNNIKILSTSQLDSTISVINFSELSNEMVVRQFDGSDTNSIIEVMSCGNINSSIVVEINGVIGYAFII